MKFWLPGVNENCLLCKRGEGKELIVMCLHSLLHPLVGQKNTGLVPAMAAQSRAMPGAFWVDPCSCFMGQG